MKKKRGKSVIVTCPECKRKYIQDSMEFTRRSEVCCPYCGICFKTGSDLMEEIQKSVESYRYHY